MKSIQFLFNKCFGTMVLVFLTVFSLSAQIVRDDRGNNNGGGNSGGGTTPNPPTETPAPIDLTVNSFTLQDNTVTREQKVSGTVKLKLASGNLKAGDKVMLLFIPDEVGYSKDPKKAYQYGPIAFNTAGEAVVEVADPDGYSTAGSFTSVVKVNPESLVAETKYDNNSKKVNVTVSPHIVDLDFKIISITAWDNMESTGKWEYRMKYRVGIKTSPSGSVTWQTDYKWWPKAPDASNESVDYMQIDKDAKDGNVAAVSNITVRLDNVSEEAYVVYEVLAYDDEKNKEDVFDNKEDEYAGKVLGEYPPIKTWKPILDTTTKGLSAQRSDKGTYSIASETKLVKVD